MADCRAPVAVFDSGLGGISVLRELVRTLPMENYLYFGDSLHAPYGTKTPEEVTQLSLQAAQKLLAQGAKALVVACNTATSAAIRTLRKTYPALAIVGTEPAIKPAAERHPGGRILMLATAMTVQEEKFQRLKAQYDEQAQIIPIACSGLMEYVEQGILRGPEVEGYLLDKLEPYLKVPIDAVVLGCTHYPFLRGAIRRIVGRRPEIIDGSFGIAKQPAQTSGRAAASEPRTGRGQRFVSELAGRAGDAGADAGAFLLRGRDAVTRRKFKKQNISRWKEKQSFRRLTIFLHTNIAL